MSINIAQCAGAEHCKKASTIVPIIIIHDTVFKNKLYETVYIERETVPY